MSRIYPNIFKLLWQAMLPCSPSMNNPNLPHMIRSCSWLGNQVNCSDIFTQVVTDSGVCCAFNVQDNLKESEYSRLVNEMRETESGDNGQVRKVTSGVSRGLEVILDQNSHRSNQSNCYRWKFITGSATKPFLHVSLVSNCSWDSHLSSPCFNETT